MTQNNSSSHASANQKKLEHRQPATGLEGDGGTEKSEKTEPDYVVGVGASAGGLEALEALFEAMPYYTNMAFVVIQHLSPDYKSMMPELLTRKTMIPVIVAEDKMRLAANTIYLLPPAKEMIVSNNCLYLTERENNEALSLPINTFFRSLAESFNERSIAIILSGSGGDGSRGGPLVHDNGGFVIAQDPETCQFDSMPNQLIETNKVDIVLAPQDMADVLVRYTQRTDKVAQHIATGKLDREENQFSDIIFLLKNRFDLDFSLYKPSTITRRIERRLAFQKVDTLRAYMDVLITNKDEIDALYCDLLIGVTCFFRDKKAFQSLDHSLGPLFKNFSEDDEIRVWVAACATGQEAYSMSILLHEALKREGTPNKTYKIFATDMHQTSAESASTGRYRREDIATLCKEHRQKYFKEIYPDCFQVDPLIRKPIVFAQHNILKDAPFTNMHIVSCRNLLIYFNQTAQQRVLSLLTFALRRKGVLFLGSSESLGKHESDFRVIDETYKIYRKARDTKHRFDINLMPKLRAVSSKPKEPIIEPKLTPKSSKALDVLLQKYVPASVLIDSQGLILHVFGNVGQFLSLEFGSASLNIRSMVSGHAKTTLSQMIARVLKTGNSVGAKNISGFTHFDAVTVHIQLLDDSPSDREYLIVSLSEGAVPAQPDADIIEKYAQSPDATDPDALGPNWAERFKELEEELIFTKESLQTTVEELESSNEELQATNEELMASNEEMQSTNEELQSVNEELFTVNAEFLEKERERDELAADEKSIIEASGIGIVFLDKNLNIRKFSEAGAKVFNLLDSDIGRSFKAMGGDMVTQVQPHIAKVYSGVELVERDFESATGSVLSICITGYRLLENAAPENEKNINPGIVITAFDVSRQRALQNSLVASEARFSEILNTISDGYIEWQCGDEQAFFNLDWLKSMGYDDNPTLKELLGDDFADFQEQVEQANPNEQKKIEQVLCFKKFDNNNAWFICKGKSQRLKDAGRAKFTGVLVDFNQYKAIERQQHTQSLKLKRSNQLLEQFAHIVSHDLKAPLRHIRNYLNFLEQAIHKGDTEAMLQEMASMSDNAALLEELIDDIITFSRVNSERKKVEQIDLNQVVDAVVKTLAPIIREKAIKVNFKNLATLPGDKSLFIHLFQNLIGNACKYNDKKEPSIQITGKEEDDKYILEVIDNGIGFDQNYSKNIFSPFKRLVTKDQYEGSGIGLSICKTVVEQHYGHISATSIPGEGSTFTVTLPLKAEYFDANDQK